MQASTGRELDGTQYTPPFDETCRLTIPQVMPLPFGMLGMNNDMFSIVAHDTPDFPDCYATYIAARDDVQFGYPILPTGFPDSYVTSETQEKEPEQKAASEPAPKIILGRSSVKLPDRKSVV